MAVVAMYLTIARGGIRADATALRHAVYVALLATGLQVGHVLEEAGMGLNRRFPESFGLAPVPMESFVTINLVALAIWVIAVFALAQGASVALFPLWFLGVACVSNAFLHPALALASGGYFPGLFTSPVVGGGGVLLLRGLVRITEPGRLSRGRGVSVERVAKADSGASNRLPSSPKLRTEPEAVSDTNPHAASNSGGEPVR